MTIKEKLAEYIGDMPGNKAISLHNEYCEHDHKYDDHIYDMDEFDEVIGERLPSDVAFMCYYGDFCPANSHFWYNGYGNLVSSDYPTTDDDSPFYVYDIVKYIVDNDDDLGNEEIREILDNAENSDDDDDDDEEEEEEE